MTVRIIKIGQLFKYTIPGEWGNDGDVENGVPVVRSTNFCNDGSLDFSDVAYRDVPKSKLKSRQIQAGDILIEKSGGSPTQPAGRVVYCPVYLGGTASNFIEVCKVSEQFDSRYVFYLLYTLYQNGLVMKYQQQTTGIINFKLNDYKEKEICIPEAKAEQQRIAEKISSLETLIAQTEALITKREHIRVGLLHDLLTYGMDEQGRLRSEEIHEFKDSPIGRVPVEWEVDTIDKITSLVGSGVTPTGGNSVYSKEGIIFLRSQNVYNDGLMLDDVAYISESIDSRMARSRIQAFDVLLNITGASIGRCCFVPAGFPKANVNQHVCIIRQKKTSHFNAAYLAAVLASSIGQRQISAQNAGGNREGLNYQQIRAFLVPLPPPAEREMITQKLMQADKLIAQQCRSLDKLKVLKTGLMHDLLTHPKAITDPVLQAAEVLSA